MQPNHTPPSEPTHAKRHPLLDKRRLLTWLGGAAAVFLSLSVLFAIYLLVVVIPRLPPLDALTDYQPKAPLRVYTADHVLMGEFGIERRQAMDLDEIPPTMKNALLAIEDARFYEHGGVDFIGMVRALLADILHTDAVQGASTITMQVARNFFLSNEKSWGRKLVEVLLAYRIEATLNKDQILEAYMNQIYLGQRAYGFAAAANVYFGKELKDITLAQAAMLAGLPKAPSANNPIVNPKRAKIRQAHILKRMRDLHYIDATQYEAALREELQLKSASNQFSLHAEHAAEMVRQYMYEQYQDEIYTQGFNVVTTLRSVDQMAAYRAMRKGLMDYEQRHGYRGPEAYIKLPAKAEAREQAIAEALQKEPDEELIRAVVLSAHPKKVQAELLNGDLITLEGDDLRFASLALNTGTPEAKRIKAGAIIRVIRKKNGRWAITQMPQVEGALVSLTPQNGAIRALVGGFDFGRNKFNRVTQAWRQPGSSFKPFVYSAALEKKIGPATVINDAPLYFPSGPGRDAWEPKDDDHPEGPMTLRTALEKSKNLVSIRILNYIGLQYARDFITLTFGFEESKLPPYLPLALGAGSATPLEMASAYAVFANGGYRVVPHLITKITTANGEELPSPPPLIAGQDAPRVLEERNAWMMTQLLQSVAQNGTGAGTNVLKRADLAGKTGTTNQARDGWFTGFQRNLVAVVWIGYDQPKSLGTREYGARLALPIWIDYMGRALRNEPQYQAPMPAGIVLFDGEFYYNNVTPGVGFVKKIELDLEHINVSELPTEVEASEGSESSTEDKPPALPAAADSIERNQILDLFK